MPELAVEPSDAPMRPDQYRVVETRAWRLGTVVAREALLHHLTEHRERLWVPAAPERDWLRERELTGRRRWLVGSEEELAALAATPDGVLPGHPADPADGVPVGRLRARYGRFDAPEEGPPRRGSWHAPTLEFLADLPRDPDALLARLRGDGSAGRYDSPFARGVGALRSGLVPADLRRPLYRALAALPSVAVCPAIDAGGVARAALVHDAGATRSELHVDRADGAFAGERDTLRADSRLGLPAGTVISSSTVRGAVVDDIGALPAWALLETGARYPRESAGD